MIGDILVEIFGQAAFGRLGRSKRAELIARLFFGLLGALLSAIGTWHFVAATPPGGFSAMRVSAIALFFFFGCFWLFNVALARRWGWPWKLCAASLVAMIVTRLAFGP